MGDGAAGLGNHPGAAAGYSNALVARSGLAGALDDAEAKFMVPAAEQDALRFRPVEPAIPEKAWRIAHDRIALRFTR